MSTPSVRSFANTRHWPQWSAAALFALTPLSWAQTQVVKPPIAQYWMDVATVSMAGMDEMPDMGALGAMMGAKGLGDNSFGATKGMMPGRWLDLAVTTQRKPGGTQATQSIPSGLGLGPTLSMLPPEPVAQKSGKTEGGEDYEGVPEKPKGRILLYWGCGDAVRADQPKVLDFANAKFEDYGKFMNGRATRERGATAIPGHAVWPNPQNKQAVPKGASLLGEHKVSGEGIPAGLQFAINQAQDFMPPLSLQTSGGGQAASVISWPAQTQARAYFLTAMGGSDNEMVIWSSSEVPEPGWGLVDYLSNANLDQWLNDKVLLPASQTQCAIPAGIFTKSKGAMVRGIAYGQELNLAHPPRPADKKIAWAPDWAARVRVKSVAMLPLDDKPAARMPSAKAAPDSGAPDETQGNKRALPSIPGLPNVGNVLKGLFGK